MTQEELENLPIGHYKVSVLTPDGPFEGLLAVHEKGLQIELKHNNPSYFRGGYISSKVARYKSQYKYSYVLRLGSVTYYFGLQPRWICLLSNVFFIGEL